MIRDNRLFTIVSLIDKKTKILLDIGTDHGLLIKKAFDENKITSAIASDVNEMPLNNARNNLKDYNVKFVISDGFKNIKDKFDTAVISGMGANLISSILNEAPKGEYELILQPNNKEENLRLYLTNNNYQIVDEQIVFESNYYYVVMKVIKGNQRLTKEELYLGPILKEKSSSIPYYKKQLSHFNYLINNQGALESKFADKIEMLNKQIKLLKL